ncbi:MAG: hypothetical protein ACOCTM_03300 [Bacteroidota bacterium]
MKKIEEEIRNSWFGDHEAEYIEINDRISVLNWREPGTVTYSVRYVFDGCYLYISGDLGEAVFSLTWTGTPESFKDINLGYFHSKIAAYPGDKYDFSRKKAKDSLQEEIDYAAEGFDLGEVADEYFEILEEMKKLADDCNNSHEWAARITYQTDLFDRLQKYNNDCWEWIYGIGDVIPTRVRAYLIGLKMAAEQLESGS